MTQIYFLTFCSYIVSYQGNSTTKQELSVCSDMNPEAPEPAEAPHLTYQW